MWVVEREGTGEGECVQEREREDVHRWHRGRVCAGGTEGEGEGEGGRMCAVEREGMCTQWRGRAQRGEGGHRRGWVCTGEGGCARVVQREGTGEGGRVQEREREGMHMQRRGKACAGGREGGRKGEREGTGKGGHAWEREREREDMCGWCRGRACAGSTEGGRKGEGEGKGGCVWVVEGEGEGEGMHGQWRGKGCMRGGEGEGMGEEREDVCRQRRGRACAGSREGGHKEEGEGGHVQAWAVKGTGKGGHVQAVGREWCTSRDGGRGNVLVSRVKEWREWIYIPES